MTLTRSRRLSIALLSALLMSLAFAVPANASISVVIQAGNPVLNPGTGLKTTWTGECPVGQVCGLWDYRKTDPGAIILTGMRNSPSYVGGYMSLNNQTEVGANEKYSPKSPYAYRIDSEATAGQWYVMASWSECQPPAAPGANLGACTTPISAVLKYRVRPMIGLPREGERARMDHHKSGRHGLFTRTSFGCNARSNKYRGSLLVQKRVKVGRRLVWRKAMSRPRVSATRNNAHSLCFVQNTWNVPRSIKRSTVLRYTWTVRTVGNAPHARTFKRTSRAFAAGTIGY